MTNISDIYSFQRPNGGQSLHYRGTRYPSHFSNDDLDNVSLSEGEDNGKGAANNGAMQNGVSDIYNRYVGNLSIGRFISLVNIYDK